MEERRNILDPTAQEFHPSASASAASSSTSVSSPSHLHYQQQQQQQHFTLLPQQILYPYPSPPPPPPPPVLPLPHPHQPAAQFSRRAYVSHGPTEALPDAIPTRSLLLSSVSQDVTEGLVRMELEGYGGVRAVDMSRLFEEGIVTVHFYDPRSAKSGMDAIRGQHMRQQARIWHQIQQQQQHVGGAHGDIAVPNWAPETSLLEYDAASVVGTGLIGGRAVWAQFAPEIMTAYGMGSSAVGLDEYCNNGSLVVFNLDPSVSSDGLRQIFEPFGAVKETRETPLKPRHKFVEFYDTRDAGRALVALNGKEVLGKKMTIQFSRPGGNGRSNYCRKTSNIHQPFQLPPRLVGLPRTSASSGRGGGGGGGGGRGGEGSSPPPESPNNGAEGSVLEQQPIPLKRDRKSQQQSSASSSSKQQQQQRSSRNKNWKTQQHSSSRSSSSSRASAEARFVIKDDSAMEVGGGSGGGSSSSSSSACKDSRTTVMIKNIPNKYSQKLLLNMLDSHCLHCNGEIAEEGEGEEERGPFSSYDFVYLPIDFSNKCNVGYGFVNMTTPEATRRLYNAFHSRPWEVFNSRKICQITYARLQGLEALMEHFRNSKFACDNDEYMPVLFSPPRDGKTCTDPSTIGGGGGGGSSIENITSNMSLLRLPSSSSHDDDVDSNDDDPLPPV